jgi:hypothetical protein
MNAPVLSITPTNQLSLCKKDDLGKKTVNTGNALGPIFNSNQEQM